ncbi:erythrocyte membrane protein 1 [Plasmodium falciparum RAJ116]|uniref:Erythrocyte membrane protein 1 n=1 Tax=Plasmodium falciparum RAJ116 TaxID=580058 RepID=A0A0L0CRW8_PLAFA|nr:erythrocyte membrane protein 1 [Plasmodium falciparum RAJ116]
MVTQGGGGGGGKDDYSDAKDFLDKIGQQVHEEVKTESNGFKDELKGDLKKATNINLKLIGTNETCDLVKQYYNKRVNNGGVVNGDPCKELSGKTFENPFSDTLGGQCTNEKMRRDGIGACAPYRRLHLCHHNLETINNTTPTASDTLLLEVCMAAKYEGDSIKTPYTIHQQKYPDSQLCTVLARSFADIGDIVRGRDLFYGNPQEKDQRKKLEKNLKDIFTQIYNDVTNDQTKKAEAEKRYNDTTNYFQLREDWWTANRHTVWEALTCDAPEGAYFHATCSDGRGGAQANNKCTCNNGDVPTYFDYVPQYLRWFEEWAEDFCRLRKRKLEDAKSKCREKVKGGEKLYCDLNRYDCTKTASGKHVFFEEDDCKGCQYSCARFVNWIDNQKLEFLKQKEKYTSEIKKYTNGITSSKRKKRDAGKSNYDRYEKKFYAKLKEKREYRTVDEFLKLLNKEEVCKKNTEIIEGGNIDFKTVHSGKNSGASGTNDINNKTFYRTTYCEACPWCGAEKVNGQNGKWEAKSDTDCAQRKEYKQENITEIPILTGDKTKSDMVQKYNKFCNGNGATGATGATGTANGKNDNQIVTWECYYDDSNDDGKKNNNCVEGKWKDFKEDQKVMSYNAFFWKWVHDMLNDSIQWRDEHSRCINKDNGNTCIRGCNSKCDCFLKWVGQKKTEWMAIKDHFKKQKDIKEKTECDPGVTLAAVLELEFLNEDSEEKSKNSLDAEEAKEIKHLRQMLQQAGVAIGVDAFAGLCTEGGVAGQNTIMDKLLEEELKDANECLQKHTCPPQQPPPVIPAGAPGVGRSADPGTSPRPAGPDTNQEDSEEEDEDDEDEEEEEAEAETAAPAATEGDGSATTDQEVTEMFYTLGDYRDICIGGDRDIVGDTIVSNTDSTEISSGKATKISDVIKQTLEKSGSKPGNSSPRSVKTPSTSDKTPQQTWWKENAPHIWHGMVCALTHKTDNPQEVDEKVKKAFFGENNNDNPGTTSGKYKEKYDYEKVKLEDTSGVKPQTTSPSGDTPTLTQFVVRPPYFRYLEEWGETFCRQRTRMLKQVEKNCTQHGDKQYSGDGEDCDKVHDDPSNFPDLGYSCPKSCRLYKKWIEKKKEEFTEQEKAYTGQKTKCKEESGGGVNGFCGTLEENAAKFLERLKSGPCSKINSAKDKKADDYISFTNTEKTFGHETYCDPCSEFKINCKENDKCSGANGNNCKDNKITAEKIGNGGNSTVLDIRVSDNNPNGFDDLNECKEAHIFKGFRKDEWKCGKVCGYVVCKRDKVEGRANDDYNKIKKKLNPCRNNGEVSKCIKDCVKKWVEEKEKEWKKLKEHYLKQYGGDDSDNSFSVKTVLEEFKERPEFKNAIKPCDFDNFKTSCGLNGDKPSPKKDGKENDLVLCMITNLEEKAKKCEQKHQNSGSPEANCVQSSPLPDDEDLLLEEENTVEQPKICPAQPKETKKEEEGDCKADVPQPDVKEEEEEEETEQPAAAGGEETNNEETPVLKPEEEATVPAGTPPLTPAAPKQPKPPKPTPQVEENPFEHPAVIPSLATSTLMWSVGISFAAISYFLLKKKPKSPVDLFRVINIPKSDYDIPTKLSPNRYIPYTSGKYRGKRYIYLEGDSGTDSGYTDHYSDITSSSESEYEELDINDIYVPGSPKYKTLIEVVLEPSKRDTQNDIHNDIPSDIPNSDTPPPITDEEWSELKHDFISNMLQNTQNTEPNMLGYNVDNNTNPKTLHVSMDEKPFITSIHDRNLLSGEDYNYDMSNNSGIYPSSSNRDSLSGTKVPYSGIDLINDTLSGNQHIDIYDEVLKRKENELFGTEHHPKHTNTHNVAKPARDDPIHNQLELFHKWLDRHRDMCEKWNTKEELLDKLKEEWNKDNNNNSDTPSDNTTPTTGITPPTSDNTPPTSDIPSGKQSDIPSSNKTLNTDVSIQIHMDNPKPINEFTYVDSNPNQVDDTYVDSNPDNSSMDTILEDLDKPFNEPYYYDMYDDDIYYDVNDDNDISTVDSNAMDVPSKVQIEMDVNTKLVKEKYPIADVWDI